MMIPSWSQAIVENARTRCAGCSACALASPKREPAWGEGYFGARVCVVVDAPDQKKDRVLSGADARSLKSAVRAGNMDEEPGVWLTPVVRCAGVDPLAAEACAPWLEVQLRTGRPRIIVAAGRDAARYFAGTDAPGLAGVWMRWRGHHVLPAADFFSGSNGVAYFRLVAGKLAALT